MLRPAPAELWPPPVVRRKDRLWLHILLVLVTLVTTTLAGVDHYLAFRNSFVAPTLSLPLLAHGLAYSLTILAILGAHEMGHYVACRYYGIDATLPFFLPAPFILTGTFGAVIRIRQPIFNKSALFDIGIAGPIAGFVIAVPALFHVDGHYLQCGPTKFRPKVISLEHAINDVLRVEVRFINVRENCDPWTFAYRLILNHRHISSGERKIRK